MLHVKTGTGLVGLPLFARRAIPLGSTGSRVSVVTREGLERRVRYMRPLANRDARQAVDAALDAFVDVDAPYERIWLELDSGNAGPVLLTRWNSSAWHPGKMNQGSGATL